MDFIRKNWQVLAVISAMCGAAAEVHWLTVEMSMMHAEMGNLNDKVDILQITTAKQGENIQWLKDVSTKNYKGD